ncbi:MAG: hypothetical protein RPV21_08975, partial [Candidatus Sedimenticola sp. (ex Thyasira tokunagai)]
ILSWPLHSTSNTLILIALTAIAYFTLRVNHAAGRIAHLRWHITALQLLGIEQLFLVVVPCTAPSQVHSPPCPTEDSRIITTFLFYALSRIAGFYFIVDSSIFISNISDISNFISSTTNRTNYNKPHETRT